MLAASFKNRYVMERWEQFLEEKKQNDMAGVQKAQDSSTETSDEDKD